MRTTGVRIDLLEQHPFQQSPADSFICQSCGKPRSQHFFDGFIPSSSPPKCSMDPSVRFNRHPAWWKPGSFSKNATTNFSTMNRTRQPARSCCVPQTVHTTSPKQGNQDASPGLRAKHVEKTQCTAAASMEGSSSSQTPIKRKHPKTTTDALGSDEKPANLGI